MTEVFYLKSSVQAEPLFHCWYTWSYLIPPASAARYLTDHYQRILDSYIRGPQFHANALKDPKMVGGPFVDFDGKRVAEVKALFEWLKTECRDLYDLSAALRELGRDLQSNAKGANLKPFYERVPELLKGFVELSYDANNSATYRVIEPLLYRSSHYRDTAQSLLLSITTGDERPFALSTPRLEDETSFKWSVPFDDSRVDQFYRLRSEPKTWPEILALFGDVRGKEALLESFFTKQVQLSPVAAYGGLRWRYFGHACVMIESGGTTVLMDPVISYGYASDQRRFTYEDVPARVDYVVITHNHQDHVMIETLLRLRHRIDTIVLPRSGRAGLHDMSLRQALERIGFPRVVELDEMETLHFPGGSLTGLPFLGEHGDLNIQSKLAYLVRGGDHTMLFAADSCGIEPRLYEHVSAMVGRVDTLFLGMECEGAPMSWVYGPLMTQPLERSLDQARRLNGSNCDQAMAIIEALECREVFIYAMGQEPWLGHVMGLKYTPESPPIVESDKLIARCAERGIPAMRLFFEHEALPRRA